MEDYGYIQFYDNISLPFNYSDVLPRFTKANLTEVAKSLNITKISALNKANLIKALAERIPENLANIFPVFDQDRFDLALALTEEKYIEADELYSHEIDYLQMHAVAYPLLYKGKEIIAMTEEAKQAFRTLNSNEDYREMVKLNTAIITLVHGMLHLYGVILLEDFMEYLENLVGADGCVAAFHIVYQACDYHDFRFHKGYLIDEHIPNPEEIIAEQESRSELDYYPYTALDFLSAADFGYDQDKPHLTKLRDYISRNWDLTEEEINFRLLSIYITIQIEEHPSSVFEVVDELFDIKDQDQAENFFPLIIEYMNNVNRWILKGYTPHQLASVHKENSKNTDNVFSIHTKTKIQRNDPCPCGSGKKFKRCCGR